MADKVEQVLLKDGTLVQHKITGYQGRIDGTTAIKSCFTSKGAALAMPNTKEAFQYRIVVPGEMMRHIAPAEDLETLEEELSVNVSCFSCHFSFRSKPRELNKPGGRCECGGWICPACLACQDFSEELVKTGGARCAKQRRRLLQASKRKKGKSVQGRI
jgi:hypothetical protein